VPVANTASGLLKMELGRHQDTQTVVFKRLFHPHGGSDFADRIDRDQGTESGHRYIVSYATKREPNMCAVKYLLITLSLLAGVSLFYAGMGFDIPEVRGVASYGLPLGIMLIVLAVMLAGFWRDSPPSSVNG
jgi:hypothetical protein